MSVNEKILSNVNRIASKESGIGEYLKILSQIDAEKDYVQIFPNGVIVVISGDDTGANVHFVGKERCLFTNITFVSARLNGYIMLGINENEILLLSPRGNLKAKYTYQKDLYCKAKKEKKNGIDYYQSGFMLYNKFSLSYQMVALKCQNKCYLTKINKLDFNDLFYVGLYDDIKTIADNPEGLVYVLYKNGTAKLFDKSFKEIKIDGLKEVLFLENGDFFAITTRGYTLYDKNAKLVKFLRDVSVKNYSRFYVVDEITFDCRTHKEVCVDGDILFSKNNLELFYHNNKVSVKETKKNPGLNVMEINDILFNIKENPVLVDKKFVVIKSGKHMLVYDWTLSKEEMKHHIFDFVKDVSSSSDLPIEVFDYLKSLCNHLSDKGGFLLKDVFLEKMIAL